MTDTRYKVGDPIRFQTPTNVDLTGVVVKATNYGTHGNQYELDNGHTVRDSKIKGYTWE